MLRVCHLQIVNKGLLKIYFSKEEKVTWRRELDKKIAVKYVSKSH